MISREDELISDSLEKREIKVDKLHLCLTLVGVRSGVHKKIWHFRLRLHYESWPSIDATAQVHGSFLEGHMLLEMVEIFNL